MEEIKKQLDRIEASTTRTEQAVFGDERIGLQGLVKEVHEQKKWRESLTVKMAVVSGVVSGAVVGGKTLLAKIFGTP